MLLAIDIGNTDTTFGVFEGEELQATWHMATSIHHMADEYAALLLNLLHHQNLAISDIKEVPCVVSSRHWLPPLARYFNDISTSHHWW